jgi:hypothetical protein
LTAVLALGARLAQHFPGKKPEEESSSPFRQCLTLLRLSLPVWRTIEGSDYVTSSAFPQRLGLLEEWRAAGHFTAIGPDGSWLASPEDGRNPGSAKPFLRRCSLLTIHSWNFPKSEGSRSGGDLLLDEQTAKIRERASYLNRVLLPLTECFGFHLDTERRISVFRKSSGGGDPSGYERGAGA